MDSVGLLDRSQRRGAHHVERALEVFLHVGDASLRRAQGLLSGAEGLRDGRIMGVAPVQKLFPARKIERFEAYKCLPLVDGTAFCAFALGSRAVGGNHAHVEDAGMLGDRAAYLVAHPLVAFEHGVGHLGRAFRGNMRVVAMFTPSSDRQPCDMGRARRPRLAAARRRSCARR